MVTIGVSLLIVDYPFSFTLIFLLDLCGFADVEAGINAIPEWTEQVGWKDKVLT